MLESGPPDEVRVRVEPAHGRRFYRRGEPGKGVELSSATLGLLSEFEDVIADRKSRVSLAWPVGPEDVGTLHSLAALSRIQSGTSDGLRTLFFPWSTGSRGFQRATLVDRVHLLNSVKPRLTTILSNPSRADQSYVLGLHSLQHISSSGKSPKNLTKALAKDPGAIHPSLFEIMPQTGISAQGSVHHYAKLFLSRVRRHTWFADSARLTELSTAAGSPFFMVGLHQQTINAKHLKSQGFDPRYGGRHPDTILLDLTQRARRRLAPKWRDAVRKFFDLILNVYGDKAPPIHAVTDDVFVAQELRFKIVHDYDERRRARSQKDRSPVRTSITFNAEPDLFGTKAFAPGKVTEVKAEAYGSELLRIQQFGFALTRNLEAMGMPDQYMEGIRSAGFVLQNLMSVPGPPKQMQEFINDNFSGLDRERVGAGYDHLRVRGLLREAVATGYAGRHQGELQDYLASVDKVGIALSSDSPGWALFDKAMRAIVQRSTRTIVVVRSETVKSFVEWRFEHASELADIRDALLKKVLLVAKRNANHAVGEDTVQRQLYSRMLFIEPIADDFLHVLTNGWTPASVRLLSSIAGAEQIRRRVDALLQIPGIAPVKQTLDVVGAELNRVLDGHFADIPDLEIAPSLPKLSALDLRAGSSVGGRRRTIISEGGIRILAFDRTEFAVYDPSELQPFSKKLAKDLVRGDQIFAIDPEFIAIARDRLNFVARASQILPQYHRVVADAARNLPGDSVTDKANSLRATILHKSPNTDLPGIQAMRAWIDVEDLIDASATDVRPNAPRSKEQYLCFMSALDVEEDLAKFYWDYAIFMTRSLRIKSGAAFHQLFMGILVDPYSVVSRLPPESSAEIWRLHEAAESRIVTVSQTAEDDE